jgi:hypothetical protein
MVFYRCSFCSSAVLGGGGRREVPFYIGCSGDEGDIVEVDYLSLLASEYLGRVLQTHSKNQLKFRL